MRGPLHGVPILIKDNIESDDGTATTAGSLALKDNVTHRDAPLVARLKDAGRGDPRQDQPVGVGQHPLEPLDLRLERPSAGWCSNPYALDRSRLRLVLGLGRGGGGQPGGGGGRHRDRRLGHLPLLDERRWWG